ncbi:hypothetical protein KJY73_13270 [Bowmanella sp. Y26]|uniref:DUF6482 family protein n=1 Tax=Bowmanella yangjiangensis TaxID=2811230 RepID=UPI001BDD26FE|nr:DUF6482 family protein [Bowmanella yangjiangensis]MBT1064554.1 hypothetical protein [Bowmanella yangjiangensis]
MTIKLTELTKTTHIEKVIIQSLDLSVFQLYVTINHQEHLVVDESGRAIRATNILSLQKLFDGIKVGQMRLRHESAYDEMIGQPAKPGGNRLEVPLGNNRLY